jgi:hypothetical protein
MLLYEEYKKEIDKHIQNNDLFLIKSYIRDDDKETIKPMDIKLIDFDLLRNGGSIILDNKTTKFNKDICRIRYKYVCKFIDFTMPLKKIEHITIVPYLCLKIQIINVIDNCMNIPEIFNNNILKIYVAPQSFSLSYTDIYKSFSFLYKKIKKNKIYGEIVDPFDYNNGYYFLEMELYNP